MTGSYTIRKELTTLHIPLMCIFNFLIAITTKFICDPQCVINPYCLMTITSTPPDEITYPTDFCYRKTEPDHRCPWNGNARHIRWTSSWIR